MKLKAKNINKILSITFLFFFLFFIFNTVSADPTTAPCWVKGTVTGNGVTISGLTVKAYLGSSLLKSGTIASDGTYSLNSVGANDGDTIALKVDGASFKTFSIVGYCGTSSAPWVVENFTVSKVSNGTSCTTDSICSSGHCINSTCGTPSSGSSTGTTGSTETIVDSSVQVETPTISDVQTILKDLNLSTDDVQQYIQSAKDGLLKIERHLVVKKTVSSTGTTTYKSTFSISVKNTSSKKLKDIKVVETIPKNIALNASEISSVYQFIVLKADPVLQSIVPSINSGETINIPYTIDKNITKADFEAMPKVVSEATVVENTTTPTDNNSSNTTDTNNISSGNNTPTLPPDYVRPKGIFSKAWSWILIILLIAFLGYLIYRHKHLSK